MVDWDFLINHFLLQLHLRLLCKQNKSANKYQLDFKINLLRRY